jgi:hypothetical protein
VFVPRGFIYLFQICGIESLANFSKKIAKLVEFAQEKNNVLQEFPNSFVLERQ